MTSINDKNPAKSDVEDDDILDQEDDVDMDLLDTSSDDLESTKEDVTLNEEVSNNNNFANDETVPMGWTYRGEGKHMFIKSPFGPIYRSRRKAMEDMIQCGKYSLLEIIDMKSKLFYEGWNSSEKLPRGWMIKKKKKNSFLLGQGGEFFTSYSEAKIFVEKYKEYFSTEDVERMRIFGNDTDTSHSKVKSESEEGLLKENLRKDFEKIKNITKPKSHGIPKAFPLGFIKNHPSVPFGWGAKEKIFGKVKLLELFSPDGKYFTGKRKALAYMSKTNYPLDQIEEMRKSLELDGWIKHENLPQNWMYKERRNVDRHRKPVVFLSPDGLFFKSKSKALEHLQKIQKIDDFSKLNMFDVSYPVGNSNIHEINGTRPFLEGFVKNHPSVPSGWRAKEKMFGKVKLLELLSPDGKLFTGKRKALAFMGKTNYPLDQIEEMRKSLELDGWMKHENLPQNWMYKECRIVDRSKKPLVFLSPDGQFFKSKNKAIKHLNQLQKIDDANVINKFYENQTPESHKIKGANGKKSNLKEQGKDFEPCKNLPEGWRYRYMKKKANTIETFYVSPTGEKFKSNRLLLKHMVKNNFPSEQVHSIRETLRKNGWISNEKVPENWLYKFWKTREHTVAIFISPCGSLFKGKKSALSFLKATGSREGINI